MSRQIITGDDYFKVLDEATDRMWKWGGTWRVFGTVGWDGTIISYGLEGGYSRMAMAPFPETGTPGGAVALVTLSQTLSQALANTFDVDYNPAFSFRDRPRPQNLAAERRQTILETYTALSPEVIQLGREMAVLLQLRKDAVNGARNHRQEILAKRDTMEPAEIEKTSAMAPYLKMIMDRGAVGRETARIRLMIDGFLFALSIQGRPDNIGHAALAMRFLEGLEIPDADTIRAIYADHGPRAGERIAAALDLIGATPEQSPPDMDTVGAPRPINGPAPI